MLQPSMDERLRRQRLIPGSDIALEMTIVRPIVSAMLVPDALRLASVLRAVRELVWNDDELWHQWWLRDFKEVQRDLPEEHWLPSWMVDNLWIRAVPAMEQSLVPAKLRALVKMRWRRWYQWSTFFRRSALYHIAQMQNEITNDWLDEWEAGHDSSEDVGDDEADQPLSPGGAKQCTCKYQASTLIWAWPLVSC